jgi:hypothetical protein
MFILALPQVLQGSAFLNFCIFFPILKLFIELLLFYFTGKNSEHYRNSERCFLMELLVWVTTLSHPFHIPSNKWATIYILHFSPCYLHLCGSRISALCPSEIHICPWISDLVTTVNMPNRNTYFFYLGKWLAEGPQVESINRM